MSKRKTEETKEEPSRPGVKRRCQEFGKNQHVENLKEDLRRHSTSPDILRQARAVAHSHPRHFLTCQGLLVASSVLATRMSSGRITQPCLEDVKTMLLIYRLSPLAQECAHADSITVLVGSLDIVETWLGHGTCRFEQMPPHIQDHYQLAAGLTDGVDLELRKRLAISCTCGPLSETQMDYYAAIMTILKEVCGAWNGTGVWANLDPCVLLQALWGMSSRAGVMPTEKEVMEFVHRQFMPHDERKDYKVRLASLRVFLCACDQVLFSCVTSLIPTLWSNFQPTKMHLCVASASAASRLSKRVKRSLQSKPVKQGSTLPAQNAGVSTV